jgi:hypothetical protein
VQPGRERAVPAELPIFCQARTNTSCASSSARSPSPARRQQSANDAADVAPIQLLERDQVALLRTGDEAPLDGAVVRDRARDSWCSSPRLVPILPRVLRRRPAVRGWNRMPPEGYGVTGVPILG